MTATTGSTYPELHLGHPVRSFVIVLVAIAAGLLLLQLSGAVMPIVTSFEGQGAGMAVDGQAQWKAVVIRNDALLPVRVESLSWPTANATDVRIDVLPKGTEVPGAPPIPSPTAPVTPFTLDGGEKRIVVLSGTTTCPQFDTRELRMVVRMAVGLDREVVVEGTGSPDGQACP